MLFLSLLLVSSVALCCYCWEREDSFLGFGCGLNGEQEKNYFMFFLGGGGAERQCMDTVVIHGK